MGPRPRKGLQQAGVGSAGGAGGGTGVGPADWGGARFPGPLSPHADEAPGRGACRRGCVTVGRSLVPGAWFFSEAVGG